MGAAIEHNLFQDYVFFIPSGGTTSTKLYSETSQAHGVGFGANYNENPRLCLVGLFTPAALTSTAFSIEVSHDGMTWVPVHNTDGTAFGVTVAPGRYTVIAPSVSFGWGHIRLVGIAEGADRSVIGRFQCV
jgi:hypothetical protein